jgi:hypothetical protein
MTSYEGRRFRKVGASEAEAPTALYRQDGDLVWAEFAGGDVRRGSLVGVCDADSRVEFTYTMVLDSGEIVAGHSVNTPQVLPDGRIRFHEEWERFGRHAGRGVSYIEEIA